MTDRNERCPAFLGGLKAVTLDHAEADRWPILTEEDEAAVLEVIRDGDLSCHPVTRELEDDYRRFAGRGHALAHCNGTAAMLAAFHALDLQPGDEVLVPSATHWASVVPMLWVGAVPVFCESEPRRMGLDPEDVARKVTSRTRAMVIVHLFGMPSKLTELRAIAEEHSLRIIEDASHAQGATWHGRKCGTFGDISVFSLQSSKLAPAGEGGVLLTDNEEYYQRCICLGDIVRILELPSAARRFAGTSFGIKTRMAPLSAAVGRVQLRHLTERNRQRDENLTYLSERLEPMGFDTFLPPAHVERTYFEFLMRYDPAQSGLSREMLVQALQAEGCQADLPRYPLLHQQPIFTEGHFAKIARLTARPDLQGPAYRPDALPATEAANEQLIRLPTMTRATRELLDQYVEAFEKVLDNAGKIAESRRPEGDGAEDCHEPR